MRKFIIAALAAAVIMPAAASAQRYGEVRQGQGEVRQDRRELDVSAPMGMVAISERHAGNSVKAGEKSGKIGVTTVRTGALAIAAVMPIVGLKGIVIAR
jgi:opacity protein-like surface antigen